MSLEEKLMNALMLQCQTYAITLDDAIRIAGEYAKEQAWESRKFAMIEHGHWPPDWREYENKQREIFEKWWEENK